MDEADIAYIRVGAEDPVAFGAFAADVIGLRPLDGAGDEVWLRSDIRRRTVVAFRGAATDGSVGIAYHRPEALDAAAARLEAAGHPVRWFDPAEAAALFIRRGLRTRDASGAWVDLVHGPHHAGRRFFPTRDNGILGLEGVAMRSLDPAADLDFWVGALGFEVRDRIGRVTLIGTDALHHRIALYPSDRAGALAVNFAVEDLELVMQNRYDLEARQARIVFGPGRQAGSGQIFLQVAAPGGLLIGLVAETARIDPARHRPRQFAGVAGSLCTWGSQPRDVPEYDLGEEGGGVATRLGPMVRLAGASG